MWTGPGEIEEGRDMVEICRGQRGCKMGSLEQGLSSHWRRWQWACPARRKGLRKAFEFSSGPTALVAG